MDKKEALQLASIAVVSIVITTIILCVIPLLGNMFVPVIVVSFLIFVWFAK